MESSRLSVRFFSHLSDSSAELYHPSEAGEVMRRQMAQKSWFDKITSWWVGRPYFVKIVSLAGLALVPGVLGAPLLLSLSIIVFSIVIDRLFIFHEENRVRSAHISTQEAATLVTNLTAQQRLLRTTVKNLVCDAEVLQGQREVMSGHVIALANDRQSIQDHNGVLANIVTEVISTNDVFLQQEKTITQNLDAVSECLENYHETITSFERAVDSENVALSKLPTTIQALQESQKIFSEAASRFTLFVSEQPVVSLKYADQAFLSKLEAELDENEKLIREWGAALAT